MTERIGALVIGIVFALVGWGCVIAGFIIQMATGLAISDTICIFSLVKHWSLWLYLGLIPAFIGKLILKGLND